MKQKTNPPQLKRSIAIALACFLVLAPVLFKLSSAWAYTTLGVQWSGSWPVVDYYINSSSFPSSVGTQTEVINAIRKGVNHWNFESNARITFVYKGTSTINTRSADGTNVIYYDSNKCTLVDNCMGQTQWWATSGYLTNFDVTLNQKDFRNNANLWDAVDPVYFHSDLWGWSGHEFGHALGLGHSSTPVATMASGAGMGATWMRVLENDDINGAQYLYGANTAIAASATSVSPGTTVTITTDFDDSVSLAYEFKASANGTSPGVDLSTTDAVDTRTLKLNTPHYTYPSPTPAPSPSPSATPWPSPTPAFQNTSGYLNSSGAGTLTWYTGSFAGVCLDFVAIVSETANNWPNNYRHVTEPIHVCVTN